MLINPSRIDLVMETPIEQIRNERLNKEDYQGSVQHKISPRTKLSSLQLTSSQQRELSPQHSVFVRVHWMDL